MIFLSLLSGALFSTLFAPFSFLFFMVVPAVVLYAFYRHHPSSSACLLNGFFFGFGYFSAGVFWVYNSLHDYGGASPFFSAFATLLFIALLSLFFAFQFLLLGFFVRRSPLLYLCFAYPSLWVLSEWLRGNAGVDFPWNLVGQAFIDFKPLSVFLPWLGVYGVSWIAVFLSALLVLFWLGTAVQRGLGIAIVVMVLVLSAYLGLMPTSQPFGEKIEVGLVQANVAQGSKFDPQKTMMIAERHQRLSRQLLGADLIVWPETAVPIFYDDYADGLLDLQKQIKETGGHFLAGFFTQGENGEYYNSMVLVDEPPRYYHKRKLVPFGEYMPMRGWLNYFSRFVDIPMSDLSAGEGDGQLSIGDYRVGVSICYEAAFGAYSAAAAAQSAYLINLSNDSWFGDSFAPHQHLQIARARAAESGRMMVRGTSTGISAIIDFDGRIVSQLNHNQEAVLRGAVQPRKGKTFYTRWRDWPVMAISFFLLLFGFFYFKSQIKRYAR